MNHAIEMLPQTPEEVKAKMDAMGITEEAFSAEVFFHYYEARNWLLRGETIAHWSSLLVCWDRNGRKKLNDRSSKSTAPSTSPSSPTAPSTTSLPLQGVGGSSLPLKGDGGSSWLDCQFPMPEEPEVREQAERLERCYSLENQPQFGMYEHWKEILTANTITLGAAAQRMGTNVVMRILIRHIDDLAAHFDTTLLTFSHHEMEQTARHILNKAPSLKFSELMLICQRAKEERMLPHTHICRGDILELIKNFPGWKRNALEFL